MWSFFPVSDVHSSGTLPVRSQLLSGRGCCIKRSDGTCACVAPRAVFTDWIDAPCEDLVWHMHTDWLDESCEDLLWHTGTCNSFELEKYAVTCSDMLSVASAHVFDLENVT